MTLPRRFFSDCSNLCRKTIKAAQATRVKVCLDFTKLRLITTQLGTISLIQSNVKWSSDHRQMAIQSVPTSDHLEPLVKQK